MDVDSLPKTVTWQRRDCDLNLGPSEPESSTLTTRLPSHPTDTMDIRQFRRYVGGTSGSWNDLNSERRR